MSYVEHGPRIFLANRHNSGTSFMYGDYVLPKKRLEGRLKLHDSCSDIRAWSPNSLESSRYFRELSEHDSLVGKIIPFNVVIDNIIRFNSQTQTELQEVKRELRKYKSLKLTLKQQEQLQNLDKTSKELPEKTKCPSELLKNAFLGACQTKSGVPAKSCIPVHISYNNCIENNTQTVSTVKNQCSQSYYFTLNSIDMDPSLNNYSLISTIKSPSIRSLSITDYNEKAMSWIEHVEVAVQVENETRDVEVQSDYWIEKHLNEMTTAISQTSIASKSLDEENSCMELDKTSSLMSNREDQSLECDMSCSKSSADIEILQESDSEILTDSDSDERKGIHKGVIIQKDSEIIVLKNELCVRDAELEELHDVNKHLEVLVKEKEDYIHTQQENLKMLHDKLLKVELEHSHEIKDLKQKLYRYRYLMEQIKQELIEKCESCYMQSQEIEKLQRKLQELEQQAIKAKSCDVALEQLKNVLHEKDELKKQNYEQNCILANQEEDLNQLLKVIEELSITYNEQVEAKNMLENLNVEIHDKNIKISEYEEQLVSMKQEISEFFNSLKNTLNNLEILNDGCESICCCTKCDLDIGEESNHILRNINIIMAQFQNYKLESQNLLRQVGDLKQYIERDKRQDILNENLRCLISEELENSSEIIDEDAVENKSDSMSQDRVNKADISKLEFQDRFSTISTESLTQEKILDSRGLTKEYHNCIIKMSKKNSVDEVEKQIIEYFAYFLLKVKTLVQKLQLYTEIERPLLLKQINYFHEILKHTQTAINTSHDVSLKKKLISNLYNQHKKENKRNDENIKQLPNDLTQLQTKINEYIETILYQLLNEILCAEKDDICNEKIDRAFERYLRLSINKINTALQGAGDQRIQIAETIEEQQRELQKKDNEIAQLKKEVEQQLVRIGEGDCVNDEKAESAAAFKEFLLNLSAESTKKDTRILKLEEQLGMYKAQLYAHDKHCTSLKKKNKNLRNIKSRLMKECQESKRQLIIKNRQIKTLIRRARELIKTEKLKKILEDKISGMEIDLVNLQSKNNELEKRITQADSIIVKRGETITALKRDIDNSEQDLIEKITEYQDAIEGKQQKILELENENKLLNEKVKSVEAKIVALNETVLSLSKQNDKIGVIYSMQDDLTKLDKNEKKLKIELNNLKSQLFTDQNNNKKLDSNLETLLRENETLKKSVEYWKNENSELSVRLQHEAMPEELKNKLYEVSNKIYERILVLKNEHLHQTLSDDQLKKELQIHQDKDMELTTKNGELVCTNQNWETKENEIDKLEILRLSSTIVKEKMVADDEYMQFGKFSMLQYNSVEPMHKMKEIDNERNVNQNETTKLLMEIEIKNAEIKHHTKVIRHLAQENADLRAVLKSQIEEYQDKLTLMKKNYDSSLNALCERHKANVEILQKQFEDNMKNERNFDSESWLQSLSMKELMELHTRISTIINSSCNVIHIENEDQCMRVNDTQGQFYTESTEMQKAFQMPSAPSMYEIVYGCFQSKIAATILNDENSHLQSQWQFLSLGDGQKYQASYRPDDKLNMQYSIRCSNSQLIPSKVENKYEKEQAEKNNNSFDKQRWNFIYQCSAYHKLSNAYEYSRILRTD